ncbi:MAG: cytochrome c maturation protein CcmE [Acidobacteriota bacterium]
MTTPATTTPKRKSPLKFIIASAIILGTVSWLAISGANDTKQYYVTIAELQGMGNKAYKLNLRVAGNVQPGSIHRNGPNADFVLTEQGRTVKVHYEGTEPPPDTFKDDAQALAIGTYRRDGTFEAQQLQAKCASKYAPAKPGEAPTGNMAPLPAAKA